MEKRHQFILIDDDPLNHLICQMTIELVYGKTDVTTFISPETGFKYIQTEYPATMNGNKTILLLDLSMPIMSGWEFLERFDNLARNIKDNIKIYILSSSIDERDKERSYANKNVSGFLIKPLTKDSINQITKA